MASIIANFKSRKWCFLAVVIY